MNLQKAEQFALDQFDKHNITTWVFKFDKATKRFGRCSYTKQMISISKKMTVLNTAKVVKDIILHEIAHIMTKGKKHGPGWITVAKSIGCNGKQFYDNTVKLPNLKYTITCKHCKYTRQTIRKKVASCPKHGNIFDKKYLLTYTLNK